MRRHSFILPPSARKREDGISTSVSARLGSQQQGSRKRLSLSLSCCSPAASWLGFASCSPSQEACLRAFQGASHRRHCRLHHLLAVPSCLLSPWPGISRSPKIRNRAREKKTKQSENTSEERHRNGDMNAFQRPLDSGS